MADAKNLILASGSKVRHQLLKNAGVAFAVIPASLDEAAVREGLLSDDNGIDAADVAEVLAQAKGTEVSRANPGALVIAADQTLSCEGKIYEKPADLDAARETLMQLRGKTHQLHSAVALVRDGNVEWAYIETAHLTMRKFSPSFASQYIVRAGADLCDSVGAYKLEGIGIQLFERIEGDYFTVLGLPLIPLLNQLHEFGVISK